MLVISPIGSAEVGVTDTVICDDGVVVTVTTEDGVVVTLTTDEGVVVTVNCVVGVTDAVICDVGIVAIYWLTSVEVLVINPIVRAEVGVTEAVI